MLLTPSLVIGIVSFLTFFVLYSSRELRRVHRVTSAAESTPPTEGGSGESKQVFFSPLGAKDEGVQGLFGSDSDLKENEPDAVERLLTSARS